MSPETAGTASRVSVSVVSFVFPCLNEEDGVGPCVEQAARAIREAGCEPEIIVVDNGSTDRSAARAEAAGARVIREPRRGYGRALRTGFEQARGEVVFMADADGTYDLARIPEFLRGITEHGADLVIGNRYHDIREGAMPTLHRYLGTPAMSWLMRLLFRTGVKDVNCGMRAFTRAAYEKMGLVTTGMELASEMVIRAIYLNLRVYEVDFTYRPRIGESKLQTMRDGLRHLRLMLLYSPDFVFLIPAVLAWVVGAVVVLVLFPHPLQIGDRIIDTHTMLMGAILNLVGLQLGSLGIVAKAYGHFTGLRRDALIAYGSGRLRLRHGLWVGLTCAAIGMVVVAGVLYNWVRAEFGAIRFDRDLVLGLVAISNGLVIAATSFVLSLMVIPHSAAHDPAQPSLP
jgi:glycosyltransferase involved in cell wall biosynthesis